MIVGLVRCDCLLDAAQSLKDKRFVVLSILCQSMRKVMLAPVKSAVRTRGSLRVGVERKLANVRAD
ncbi:MAG: DUF503 family protein [Sporolactobacillus sp.]